MKKLIVLLLIVGCATFVFLFLTYKKENSKPEPAVKIEESVFLGYKAISVRRNSTIDSIESSLSGSYIEIVKVMSKYKLKQAAPALAIFHSFSYDTIDFEACIPVNKTPEDLINGFNYIEKTDCKTVVGHHYGSHLSTEKTHLLMDIWLKANNKKVVGAPWEVYITDPMLESDTSKWYTQIYYPID